jgi:DNA-directed RNA polymerase subunit RPC12/RpoP
VSNRTFACLRCRKLQRKPMSLRAFACPHCHSECVCVHWKLHVPAPRKRRKWDRFWAQYLLELRTIEQFRQGLLGNEVYLPLLNQRLQVRA